MFYHLIFLLLFFSMPGNIIEDIGNKTPSLSDNESKSITVKKTPDFKISGDGSAKNWSLTDWIIIPQRDLENAALVTKAKALYSDKGIYFLFYCEDKILTASMEEDFMDLWTEDVVEVFLMPDENIPAYFEYEISPLNFELPILVSNYNNDLTRWMPFHYDADRKVIHATTIEGSTKKNNATVKSWTAEFFIPFKLLRPLNNIQPVSGTKWKANFYRLDYDVNKTKWSWNLTETNFHDYKNFGSFFFE